MIDRLIAAAKAARANAWAPYSKYKVGAAVATASGKIFAGCNFENASYGACICAERNAVGQMIAAGEHDVAACVVVTSVADDGEPGSPCGICRQVLAEFATDAAPVVLIGEAAGGGADVRRDTTLGALLPRAFRSFAPSSG